MMSVGFGILLQGILWLIFWLGPAFPLFRSDPRWGHNFALPILFINVGVASYSRSISCQLVAVFATFLTVPIELAFLPWSIATLSAIVLLITTVALHLIEKTRETELLSPRPRLKAWLKIHLLSFAYIGLAHMSLIFFLVRWFNPDPFTAYLPVEHEPSTSIFNLMLLVLTPIALMERYVKQIGGLQISRIGFALAILMIVLPLLSIALLGS
jgi:hypothetical protein